jgi:hypothetical protein
MAVRPASPSHAANILPCAGLIVSPFVWVVTMQLSQILPYLDCRSGLQTSAVAPVVATLLTIGAVYLSWRSTGPEPDIWGESAYPATRRFAALLGCLAGGIFAYALLLQALSAFLLTGCER